jgi:hypothetical protein
MEWHAPAFVELNMSAEIGAYQDDFGGGNQPPLRQVETSPGPPPRDPGASS